MKVIVKGKIVETSFISSIEKIWKHYDAPANGTTTMLYLKIHFIFDSSLIIFTDGGTNNYYLEPDEESKIQMIEMEKEAERIIKFLDKHSDKPNLPYPVFE